MEPVVMNLQLVCSDENIHLIPTWVDSKKFKIKIYSLSPINETMKVAVYYNSRRQYFENSENGTKKSFLHSLADKIYIEPHPYQKEMFVYNTNKVENGFILTVTRINNKAWGEVKEYIWSELPIVKQEYTLKNVLNEVIEVPDEITLYQHPIEYEQKVPKRIVQTGAKPYDKLSPLIKIYSEVWKGYNPEYEFVYYDDQACYDFLHKNYGEEIARAYTLLPKGAMKADFFRICEIAENGGVYADLGTYPHTPLQTVIKPTTNLLVVKNLGLTTVIFNGVFAASKNNEFFQYVKSVFFAKLHKGFIHGHIFDIFGPACIGTLFKRFFKYNSYLLPMETDNLTIIEHSNAHYYGRRIFRSLQQIVCEKVKFEHPYYKKYKELVSTSAHY